MNFKTLSSFFHLRICFFYSNFLVNITEETSKIVILILNIDK